MGKKVLSWYTKSINTQFVLFAKSHHQRRQSHPVSHFAALGADVVLAENDWRFPVNQGVIGWNTPRPHY